jgi:hypothetical protein
MFQRSTYDFVIRKCDVTRNLSRAFPSAFEVPPLGNQQSRASSTPHPPYASHTAHRTRRAPPPSNSLNFADQRSPVFHILQLRAASSFTGVVLQDEFTANVTNVAV